MNVRGFEHRATDLSRGVLVIRARRDLDGTEQHSILSELAEAGMTALPEYERIDPGLRRLLAFPWAPPDKSALDAHRAVLARLDETFGFEEIICFKVETAVDGATWAEPPINDDEPADPDTDLADPGDEPSADDGEVLFSTPDASLLEASGPVATRASAEPHDDAASNENWDDAAVSFWRNGPPPIERELQFPVENNPSILDDETWEEFGLAIKLAGEEQLGEESVVNAFFALWLSVFQDERAADFQVFEHAHVVHDRTHRSAMLWVDHFSMPVDIGELSGFLLWIAARLNEVIPLVWVRFDPSPSGERYPADPNDTFVLAGNPLAERLARSGEEVALQWGESQTLWSKRELAAMLVEIALENDPDEEESAEHARRLLDKARDWDPDSDAISYLISVWVRQDDVDGALATCTHTRDPRLITQLVGEVAEHRAAELPRVLAELGRDSFALLSDDDLGELTEAIGKHAAVDLPTWLPLLPDRSALIPHLYNASFHVSRELALEVLERTLTLPEPLGDDTARTAYLRAWNNACIHAHAQGEVARAVALAERGKKYAAENPHIYHAAACAHSAAGNKEAALAAVRAAIAAGYEHIEKLETDGDLGELLGDQRFLDMFEEWRGGRADLN